MSTRFTAGQHAMLVAALQLRRGQLDRQLAVHQEGHSRVEHAADVAGQDSDDAPKRAMEREVDFALSDLDARELLAVDRALQRLQDGHYGDCVDCGVEIPFDRLRVEPHAERCVRCETLHERGATRGR